MKQLRQRAIRDLLEQRTIRTQQELAAALRERGFRTTQATISRDVAELGLIKVAARRHAGLCPAAAPDRGRDERRGPPAQAPARAAGRGPRVGPAAGPAHAAGLGPRDRGGARPGALAGGRGLDRRATTRCSSRSPTGARCSGSASACSASRSSARLRPRTTVDADARRRSARGAADLDQRERRRASATSDRTAPRARTTGRCLAEGAGRDAVHGPALRPAASRFDTSLPAYHSGRSELRRAHVAAPGVLSFIRACGRRPLNGLLAGPAPGVSPREQQAHLPLPRRPREAPRASSRR